MEGDTVAASDHSEENVEEFIGATAVNAATIERQIMQETEHGAGEEAEAQRSDADTLQNKLRDVRRELRAVRSAVHKMEQADTSQDPRDEGTAVPLAHGELQHAVMQQRLAGLEAQEAALRTVFEEAGLQPEDDGPTEEAMQDVLLAARKKKGKGGKAGRSVQFDLQEDDLFDAAAAATAAAQGRGGASLVETERDRLIRLGVLTPFDRLGGFERRLETGIPAPEAEASIARVGEKVRAMKASKHTSMLVDSSELPRPERQAKRMDEGFWRAAASKHNAVPKTKRRRTLQGSGRLRRHSDSHEGGVEVEGEEEGEEEEDEEEGSSSGEGSEGDVAVDAAGHLDDADEAAFDRRQEAYYDQQSRRRSRARRRVDTLASADGEDNIDEVDERAEGGNEQGENIEVEEESAEEEEEDVVFEGGYRVPGDIYSRLFDYQRTGVKWLWELHTQRAGGIIGDEMGLGKTVQIIAFLAGLHRSGMFRPSLIICPATVLRQWLREMRAWYPPFRVAILHESAGRSGTGGVNGAGGRPSLRAIVRQIASSPAGILLTTYDQLRLRREDILAVNWGYAVLDEGHKIRNPDAEVTLTAKQLPTVHRLIMTGSPIQNRLTELWSLFDFVFPGKLGTLPVFQAQFAIPIQVGGYSNASPLQVSAAYKCALVLRDLISPYLLRRRKADVAKSLPAKTERVLFCTLTTEQRDMYRSYLASKELGDILSGSRAALAGIDILRKICNHPDLLERAKWEAAADYGNPERSGKMVVLDRVLGHWHNQKHKVLVFTQTQQMLDIIERLAVSRNWRYHRMDGSTSISTRARLIDDFNDNPDIFAFLLTTRVGGLGVNLVGANRCIIYDPDWNPSTDVQARERAWRIGQSREVTVYRLLSSGTIEEKVYHRQVYKQFLTDRVLRDPRQRRFFKARDLSDLFTLGDEYADGTETAAIFASLGTEITAGDVEQETDGAGALGSGGGSASDRDDYDGGPGVVREEAVEGTAAGRGEVENSNDQGNGGDARILRDLFDGTGVHAALDHSKIEGAHDPEHRTAQREASKIAERAAEALRKSRLQVQSAPVARPTWTGKSGAAGAPRFGAAVNARLQQPSAGSGASGSGSGTLAASRFGGDSGAGATAGGGALRSSDLLAQMRQRQAATETPEVARAQTLAQRIASFLQGRGGSAPSNDVAASFQLSLGSGDLPLFRSVLKQVAQLQRESGVKRWVLRPEFVSDQT